MMCESLAKEAVCSMCLGAGLMRPGAVCPLCLGRGYRTAAELIEQTVVALSRAANRYGGPATVALDELRRRWRSPEPSSVTKALDGCEDARERLRAAGFACSVEGGYIRIELLATTKPDEPS